MTVETLESRAADKSALVRVRIPENSNNPTKENAMNPKKLASIVLLALLTLSLTAGSTLAQPAGGQTMTVVGKIAQDQALGGYYIQGEKPPEVYRIVNQNPAVLASYAKSGKTVTIEAQAVLGDNLAITKIDGKKYQEGQSK